ncbi:Peptidyl-alpha-hydroxyglycine alpha-amidating lyase 2 [Frankliniella fusca]|uniref:peptidylamidoglycolate lyase n=1 Tax=Frankliniella fusca TaxID=407009 RepID=A0AAE1I4N6_9NEOP|nr:Peptidyl-alpha-hydroxyglycine alpha-amidating lyase 2 [Frankliniella fusca]
MARKRRWGLAAPLTLALLLALLAARDAAEARAINNVHDLSSELYSEIRELMQRALHQRDEAVPCLAEQLGAAPAPAHPRLVPSWPLHGPPPLGQVAGVAVALNGFPVVFHRGARVFNSQSFNESHHFQFVDEGPIPEDTVLTLDPDNGDVLTGWGRDLFYMPHSITIDNRGNTWLTDVALHQVFKFAPGSTKPSLILGQALAPGPGKHQLCMPTDVAVASTGEVFVADGYCNSRVLKFDPNGVLLRLYPQGDDLQLQVPHSVALLERLDMVCVADRENMRVVCPSAELRAERAPGPPATIKAEELGRVFAVAAYGDYLYAVNGYTADNIRVGGFTLDPAGESLIDRWGPPQGMSSPHSVAVSPDGSALYVAEIGPNRVWKFDLPQAA